MAKSGATTTGAKRPKVERAPIEHAARRLKQQIELVDATDKLFPDQKDNLMDFLAGVINVLEQAPQALVPQDGTVFAQLVALGRSKRTFASSLFGGKAPE